MRKINAKGMSHKEINDVLRATQEDCEITDCCGQRFIAAGMTKKNITIDGTPGNALGAYLDGANITVNGNAQDAVGDTMNEGKIIIHGNIGDAAGYAMRGGRIFVKGNAGYRAGIHMKEYKEKSPVMIIGGVCGSFLGEYQAGGTIVVLGLDAGENKIVGNFPCTGMHGGRMLLRGKCEDIAFSDKVCPRPATSEDIAPVKENISEFCEIFGLDEAEIMHSDFTIVTPDSKNPYKQMYVAN